MNTRGIVQLVVLNVGVELGVLSPMLFAIFVVTALILIFFTSPLLYLVYLRKNKPTTVINKVIENPLEIPVPAKRTHLYVNPIVNKYRKWQLAPPSP
jgi:hypothetical protein